MPPAPWLHHVSLTVTDLDRSAEWYRTVLGLEEAGRRDGPSWRKVVLRSGDFLLALTAHDGTQAQDRFDETRVGLDHVAVGCRDRAALEAWWPTSTRPALRTALSPRRRTPTCSPAATPTGSRWSSTGWSPEGDLPAGARRLRATADDGGALHVVPALRRRWCTGVRGARRPGGAPRRMNPAHR